MRVTTAQWLGGQWVQAANSAVRAERAAETLERNAARASWLAAVSGMAALMQSNYKTAARLFTSVRLPASDDDAPTPAAKPSGAASKTPKAADDDADADVDDKSNKSSAATTTASKTATATATATTVSSKDATLPAGVTASDAALIGALCTLASGDRADLRRRVLDSDTFAPVIAREPELRSLVEDFVASRYASALTRLEAMRPRLLLDIFLGPHAHTLIERIRRRALVQYFSPYSSVGNANRLLYCFRTTLKFASCD
jgi:hypothetical protein